MRETGSVLCQTALWDCFGNAIAFLLAITKLRARLGQCCVKLHYGIVLGTQSLLLLAITKLRARLGQCYVKLHYGIILGTLSLLLLAITSNS